MHKATPGSRGRGSHIVRWRSARTAIIASVALASVGIAGCTSAPAPEVDRTLTIAVDGVTFALENWDPSQTLAGIPGYLAFQAVTSPLFYYSPTGEPIPSLGTGYTVSEDRTTFDVTLREGVVFDDGTPMDAEGVVAFYDHLLSEESTYPGTETAHNAGAEFSVTGEYTFRLTFSKPFFHPDNFYWDIVRLMFGGVPVRSPATIDDPAGTSGEPMSIGPYVLEEYVPEVSAVFVRNPDYWDPEAYPFDTVELKYLVDPIAKLNALKSGQVDAASLASSQVSEAESSGFVVRHASTGFYSLFVRDVADSTLEPLRDVRVRQAMMYAFDRELIAETLDLGYGRASSQVYIEGQAEYIEGGDERFGYDVDRALELMADAGYADGFDVVIPTHAGLESVEPIVQQSLGEIGIRVTYERFPDFLDFLRAMMGGEYPLILYQAGNADGIRFLDEEIIGFGRFFAKNPELDALLLDIKLGDPEESAEASQELGEMLLEDAWYVPFSRPAVFWGSTPEVEVVMNDTFGGGVWLHDFQIAD